MPGFSVQVALSEVLEVKGTPLLETEAWAVLSSAVESLQDLFSKGHAVLNEGPRFALTPDTIVLNNQGDVNFAESSFDSIRNQDFLSPEWNPREYFSDAQVEMIYVFALGVSIYSSMDYKLAKDEALDISDELDNLLGDMCEDDAEHRFMLADVIHTCAEHSRRQPQRVANSVYIQQLYKQLLGSDLEGSDILDSDSTNIHHQPPAVPRLNLSQKPRATSAERERPRSAGARPRSRSKSKTRSRSQSADRHSLPNDNILYQNNHHHSNRPKYPSIPRNLHSNIHNNPHHQQFQPNYPGYHYVQPYFGSQPNLYTPPSVFDPYLGASPASLHGYGGGVGGRKIVGQPAPKDHPYFPHGGYGGWRSVPLQYEEDMGYHSQGSLIKDPHVRHMYERLKHRQKKLQALRMGLEVEDSPDIYSSGSEYGDRRSVTSAHSYTPDLRQNYGLDMDHANNPHSDASWVERQEHDILAMQRALDDFKNIKNNARQSRQRTKSPPGSRPGSARPAESRTLQAQNSRPSSQPSRPNSTKSRSRPQSQTREKTPHKTPRKFYGPEFIQSDRIISANIPTTKKSSSAHIRHVYVHLLNGDKLDVTCDTGTLGKDLCDLVVAHLALPEHYLFGLTFSQDGEYFFVDPDEKLNKMAPVHWKDPGKGRPNIPWTTYFKVKFYVENPSILQHPTTRHLFYLQIRKDMLEGKIHCSEEQAMTVAGYAMQAEYGDWYDKSLCFIPEMYLPSRVMKRVGKAYAKENIPIQHRKHCNMADEKAELAFIKQILQLQEYGMHFYKLYNSKKDTGNPIWMGVSVQGLVLSEQRETSRVITQRHPWQFTQKVSFSRKRFSISPKSDTGNMKLQKMNFYTDTVKKGRYLLHLCTAHHRFQIMMRQKVEPNLQDMFDDDFDEVDTANGEVDDEYDDEEEEDYNGDDDVQYDEQLTDDDYRQQSYDQTEGDYNQGEDEELEVAEYLENSEGFIPSHYDTLPGNVSRPRSRSSSQDVLSHQRNTPVSSRPPIPHHNHSSSRPNSRGVNSRPNSRGANSRPNSRPTTPGAHVIDISFNTHGSDSELDLYLADHEMDWLSDPLSKKKLDQYALHNSSMTDRRIIIIELQKEDEYGIGLSIVGGENTGKLDLGIFVKAIIPGGPAHSNGDIHPGDRIIAINGQSLEGIPHHKAVEMIRDSPDIVQLLISQPVGGGDYRNIRGILTSESDASLMDDLDSHRFNNVNNKGRYTPNRITTPGTDQDTSYYRESGDGDQRQHHSSSVISPNISHSMNLSQVNSLLLRPDSVNSSDLELEDVIPAAALDKQYVEDHKSPVSPYVNTEVYRPPPMFSSDESLRRVSMEYQLENDGGGGPGLIVAAASPGGGFTDDQNGYDSEAEMEDVNNLRLDLNKLSPTDELQQQFAGSELMSSPEPISAHSTARTPRSPNSQLTDQYTASGATDLLQKQNLDHLEPGDQYEILLKKTSNSLGLNVAGGCNTTVRDGGIYVKSLAEEGAAENDGRIHVGDKVLEVNGVSLAGVTHKQAVETLRSAPPICHLLMVRGVPPKRKASGPSSPTPIASPSLADQELTVTDSLRTDDGVVSPSENSISRLTPSTAFEVQEELGDTYPFVDQDNIYTVGLDKSNTGLGFSVLGGCDVHPDILHCLVRVKKIFSHGPAYGSGLQEGDTILQVDDIYLKDLTNKEVMTVLRSTPPHVELLICRPEEGVLPTMEEVRRDLLDNTMESDIGGIPVAISTPTADLLLSDNAPAFQHKRLEEGRAGYYNAREEAGSSRQGEVIESERTETVYTTDYTDTPATTYRSETSGNRTPSPVKTFMMDAGLGSYQTTPAETPSIEYMGSHQSETGDEEEEENYDEQGFHRDEDEDEIEPDIFEVTLTKGDKGLGFTVAGGQQTTGFFYVKDILFNPALSDGRIRKGDRLIMVNDQDMTGMNHKEAVNFLRQTPQTVSLVFERPQEWDDSDETPTPVPSPSLKMIQSKKEQIQSESSDKVVGHQSVVTENEDSNPQENAVIKKGKPEKQVDIKPHITVPNIEVEDSAKEESSGYHVDRSAEHTPTPDDNLLNASKDEVEVLSIASSFGNVTLPMSDLEDSGTPVNQTVKEKKSLSKPEAARTLISTPTNQSATIYVEIRKPPEGSLGFTLIQGEKGTAAALYVRNIIPGGLADKQGKLRIGDKLLQVNGESVIGIPHNEAVALIKKASGTLTLALTRAVTKEDSKPNTPAPTPSKELEEVYKKQLNAAELEQQEAIDTLVKSVTPGLDKHYDTDSDVDSATLDDDDNASTIGAESSDGEQDDKFVEGSLAYNKFMEAKGGVQREIVSSSRNSTKAEPKQNTINRFNRVPPQITNSWLSSMDLVVPPEGNLHYNGRELQMTLKALKVKVERDDTVEEYKSLRHHKLTDNCIEARKPENKLKNRYRNVLPYDATRVELQGQDDYINASHVRYQVTKTSKLHYIATQGPMPATTGDFWRMIWELKVQVIAMVTQDMEGGKVKCHRYWPDSMDSPITVNHRYEVSLLNVQRLEQFDVHKFKITDTQEDEYQIVSHLNFTMWPDQGTPDSGIPLLQYIKLMHLLHDTGPIVVHCSAGIGRTGALITLDVVRALIESDNKFDIKKIVQDIRRQRQGMIQTKDQYRFCYRTVVEALVSLNKEIMSMKKMGDTL